MCDYGRFQCAQLAAVPGHGSQMNAQWLQQWHLSVGKLNAPWHPINGTATKQ